MFPASLDPTSLISRAIRADGHGTPLPLSVQRDLTSTLGVRVENVRVARGPAVTAALDAHGADALALPGTILLRPDTDLNSPGGLGLLAHEFTHILRDARPDFLPRVLQGERRSLDEEQVAVHTEQQVRQRFRSSAEPAVPASPVDAPAAPAPVSTPNRLPAPWEPMPYWEVSAPHIRGAEPAPPAPSLSIPSGVAPTRAAARAAEPTRSLPSPATTGTGERKQTTPVVGNRDQQQRGPDLDTLAREVYAVIKSRLDTEMKRLR